MDKKQALSQLSKINEKVNLIEGKEGLLRVLSIIERTPQITTQSLSRKTGFPVPICVAIKNEFIKAGLCKRDEKGIRITENGKKIIVSINPVNKDFSCEKCEGLGLVFSYEKREKLLEQLKQFCEMRGVPDTIIDQSYATPETILARVLYMAHKFDLIYNNYAFVGDSDLTSIALALVLNNGNKISVFDIDEKIGKILGVANRKLGLNIEFVKHDLKHPIPEQYLEKYDCIITDPPYTVNGCTLFLSRGVSLLNNITPGVIYLSFSNKTPKELQQIQKSVLNMGCIFSDILLNFNTYIGAQKIGGVSNLYRLLAFPPLKPEIKGNFTEPIYTGQSNIKIRTYRCITCKTEVSVGYKHKYRTIEQLKNEGCPQCFHKKFKKISEKSIE
ncbi:MAG: bis-aminopropyl spermidine synthase family protein [Candidatus Heimdallarchaeaceae archaeon]